MSLATAASHALATAPASSVTPRLVPALVNGQPIQIPCFAWCVTDHVAENERHLEDIAHAGAMADLVVPGGEPGYRLLAHTRLGADLFAPTVEERKSFVVIDDGSEAHHLTEGQSLQFADRLVAFAEEVRALARSIA